MIFLAIIFAALVPLPLPPTGKPVLSMRPRSGLAAKQLVVAPSDEWG